jgi:hypothetical protein
MEGMRHESLGVVPAEVSISRLEKLQVLVLSQPMEVVLLIQEVLAAAVGWLSITQTVLLLALLFLPTEGHKLQMVIIGPGPGHFMLET